jgi:hypothetical protein
VGGVPVTMALHVPVVLAGVQLGADPGAFQSEAKVHDG